MPPLTVLCITGWCRNGSTILGNVLNEVPGVFHVGELHFLWRNSVGRGANSRCGCGRHLTDCPVWSRILPVGRPAGTSPAAHAAEVIRRQRTAVRTRHTWRLLRRGPDRPDARAHAELMTAVYRAVAERTGSRVLVDTTKIPGEAALLPHLPGIETVFVHLVRDPRAVAQSWSREKDYVYTLPARTSTAYWTGFNLAATALVRRHRDRSLVLRYEDFIADPAGTVALLLRRVGVDPAANPVRGRTVELHTNHTVTGNPDRFATGSTVLRPADDRWRTELPPAARLAAVTLSGPLFTRYGYRYRGTFGAAPAPAGDPAMREGP